MRPLDKGANPVDVNGNPITVNNYDYWREELINRIGYYCAYCNMPLSHSLQVEHVVPKNPPVGYTAGDALAWDNMLLACGPCNNAKSNTPVNFVTYYFPEEHNTLLPFMIRPNPANTAAFVVPVRHLTANQLIKAQATIALTKLNVVDRRSKVVDIRWKRRKDAIKAVLGVYEMYNELKTTATFNASRYGAHIAEIAKNTGFFSLWFECFYNEPDVIEQLILGLPGTAAVCFDPASGFVPINRNSTNATDPF